MAKHQFCTVSNNTLLPFNTTTKTTNISADTKPASQITVGYKATLIQTVSHSQAQVSANQINQLVQQITFNYNPFKTLQFSFLGENYFTRQKDNPDIKYFFVDASVKFRAIKLKTDFEVSAVNLLNLKMYSALYLSANNFTSTEHSLPGRITMIKIMFNI